jgi:hypothetical protein
MSGPTTAIIVKQEPGDVQGMLDAWEDFDCSIADAKVVQVVAEAAAGVVDAESTSKVKVEYGISAKLRVLRVLLRGPAFAFVNMGKMGGSHQRNSAFAARNGSGCLGVALTKVRTRIPIAITEIDPSKSN